jgi:hypothetical protein
VLKDLFALDDGGARLAAGENLGSVLCRHGLVALLLSFLLALGPIKPRGARAAAAGAGAEPVPSQPGFGGLVSPSLMTTAESFPKQPPYLGFRTDIVAGALLRQHFIALLCCSVDLFKFRTFLVCPDNVLWSSKSPMAR